MNLKEAHHGMTGFQSYEDLTSSLSRLGSLLYFSDVWDIEELFNITETIVICIIHLPICSKVPTNHVFSFSPQCAGFLTSTPQSQLNVSKHGNWNDL